MDAHALAKLAQQLVAAGELPCGPHRVFAGYGGSADCALCRQPIQGHEVIYEVDMEVEGGRRTLCFHGACESAWRAECERHHPPPQPSH